MNKTIFTKDASNSTITVERTFNALKSRVWNAWTDKDILEKWFAPKPWKAVTKSFEFKEGGHWHYSMRGPAGEEVWGITEYVEITPEDSFVALDSFCDEEGVKSTDVGTSTWTATFTEVGESTQVRILIRFASEFDMQKTVEMGFEEGFSMGLDSLEEFFTKE